MKRIGGEFELGLARAHGRRGGLPTFGLPYEIWLNAARNGLRLALDAIAGQSSRRVWLPSFLCPEVLSPFLERGYALQYYPVDADLGVTHFPSAGNGDTVLFIHYFGFPNHGVLGWLETLKDKDVWVIEDAVQSPVPISPHPRANFALASPRKCFPLSDGALLGSRHAVRAPAEYTPHSLVIKKSLGRFLRAFDWMPDALFLGLLQRAEKDLTDLPPMRISPAAFRHLQSIDVQDAGGKRRTNFSALSAMMPDVPLLRPLFPHLPADVIPLGLPVTVAGGKRNQLRADLMRANIFCAVHWPLADVPLLPETEAAHRLSADILTLPIDQRYTLADMHYIGDVLRRTTL
jgi:hypothetical protein